MSKDKLSKRDLVLVAASEVVIEHGAAQLTLDAVVNNAGVSKGGLLYHFP
ncbi:MAG: helix-turn-helix domain-containing protein, partial [Chloroflexota bacterium]